MKNPKEYIFLLDAFKSLPNIGTKGATKIANFFLAQDEKYQKEFISRLQNASNKLTSCKYCNSISISEICEICNSTTREKSICVVSNLEDQQRIEESRLFKGYYHILKINPNKNLNLTDFDVSKLIDQMRVLGINEVVIATSFSIYGEVIAEYIKSQLSSMEGVNVYRIGFGIPLNANIDYIDDETIKQSFVNKKKIS